MEDRSELYYLLYRLLIEIRASDSLVDVQCMATIFHHVPLMMDQSRSSPEILEDVRNVAKRFPDLDVRICQWIEEARRTRERSK